MKNTKHLIKKVAIRVKILVLEIRKKGLKRVCIGLFEKYRSIKSTTMYIESFISKGDLEEQRKESFAFSPMISIIVPLYRTNILYFEQMLNSVLNQSYEKWELLLINAGVHESILKKIDRLNDKRINLININENLGISENSNIGFLHSRGEYVSLLDHDDMLSEQCLYHVVKTINETQADVLYTDEITFKSDPKKDCYLPNLKPDFSPDTLRSYNYICHFLVFNKNLIREEEKLFNKDMDGSQDYDLILRLTERTKNIAHIDKVLYYWRAHKDSVANSISAKPYALESAKLALKNHLKSVNLEGEVSNSTIPTTYKVNYYIKNKALVSIIIPNKNHIEDLGNCILSIMKSSYTDFEIIIVENNSNKDTLNFYDDLRLNNSKVRIVTYKGQFNYSAINNYGVKYAKGDYFLFLNNDIEIITPNWIEEMLMFAQRTDVGCVGCKLLYPDNTIQHAGVILGIGSVAGHSHKHYSRDAYGFMSRLQIVQNVSAVTGACLLVKRIDFNLVNGFDENFKVAFNDIDFCLKLRKNKKINIYTPYAEAYHFESKSRGIEDSAEKIKRFNNEIKLFEKKWGLWIKDPYYNINLSLLYEDFRLKRKKEVRRIN